MIDFDALRAQIPPPADGEASGSGPDAGFYDFQVALAGSEPDYQEEQMWGNESDGGSDMDVGNDTFLHVTGDKEMVMLGERPFTLRLSEEEDTSTSILGGLTRRDDHAGDETIMASSPAPPVDQTLEEYEADTTILARSSSPPDLGAEEVETETFTTVARSPSAAFVETSEIVPEISPAKGSPARSERQTSIVSHASSHASEVDGVLSPARSTHLASIASESSARSRPTPDLDSPTRPQDSSANLIRRSPSGSPARSERNVDVAEAVVDREDEADIDEGIDDVAPILAPAAHEALDSTTPAYSPVRLTITSPRSPVRIPGSPIFSPVKSLRASPAPVTARLSSLAPSSPLADQDVQDQEHRSTTPMWSPPTLLHARAVSPAISISRFGKAPSSTRASPVQSPRPIPETLQVVSPARSTSYRSPSPAVGALGLFLNHETSVSVTGLPSSPSLDDHEEGAEDEINALAEYDESLTETIVDFKHDHEERDDLSEHDHDHEQDKEHEDEQTVELESTTPTAPIPTLKEVMSSPRVPQSPLPDLADDLTPETEDDVPGKIEAEIKTTTPSAPVPAQLGGSPSLYPLSFSPRYASPLRTVQTPLSPIRAVQSSRFEDPEECHSGDITLEGNSADWSLSDDDNSRELEVEGEDQEDLPESELETLPVEPSNVSDEQQKEEDVMNSSIVTSDDVLAADTTPEGLDSEPEDELVDQEQDQEQDDQHPQALITPVFLPELESNADLSSDSLAADTTLEESNSFESQTDDEQATHDDAEPQQDEDEEEPETEIPENVKIVLKVRNIGTVKVEPQDPGAEAPPTPPMTAFSDTQEGRSTTPAYDPPARRSTPARQSTPLIARSTRPHESSPTPSPDCRQSSITAESVNAPHHSDAVHISRSSARPRSRSRLSRQPTEVDEEHDTSIRVRSRPSLGDELYQADESMRSVVEVSSLDPKAAARAAAILKMASPSLARRVM